MNINGASMNIKDNGIIVALATIGLLAGAGVVKGRTGSRFRFHDVDVASLRGTIEMEWPDGWTAERLTTAEMLDEEGTILQTDIGPKSMPHWWKGVRDRKWKIVSLRHEGKPVQTMLIEGNMIKMSHGLRDRKPSSDEMKKIEEYANEMGHGIRLI